MTESESWMCTVCGWIYDESVGDPEHGVPAGTRWADVPAEWTCPECGAAKTAFEKIEF